MILTTSHQPIACFLLFWVHFSAESGETGSPLSTSCVNLGRVPSSLRVMMSSFITMHTIIIMLPALPMAAEMGKRDRGVWYNG